MPTTKQTPCPDRTVKGIRRMQHRVWSESKQRWVCELMPLKKQRQLEAKYAKQSINGQWEDALNNTGDLEVTSRALNEIFSKKAPKKVSWAKPLGRRKTYRVNGPMRPLKKRKPQRPLTNALEINMKNRQHFAQTRNKYFKQLYDKSGMDPTRVNYPTFVALKKRHQRTGNNAEFEADILNLLNPAPKK